MSQREKPPGAARPAQAANLADARSAGAVDTRASDVRSAGTAGTVRSRRDDGQPDPVRRSLLAAMALCPLLPACEFVELYEEDVPGPPTPPPGSSSTSPPGTGPTAGPTGTTPSGTPPTGTTPSGPPTAAPTSVTPTPTRSGLRADFDLAEEGFGELAAPGGLACVNAGAIRVLLIRIDEDTVVALERTCPHQNLNMGPCDNNPLVAELNLNEGMLECRWHGSRFDARDGSLIRGPARRDLQSWDVEFNPDTGRGTVFFASRIVVPDPSAEAR